MAIEIPDLHGASCIWFIACGRIDTEETEAAQWVKQHQAQMIAKVTSSAKPLWIRAIFGSESTPGHFHLDFATRALFAKSKVPKPDTTWLAIQSAAKPLMNIKPNAVVEVEGHYEISIKKLPAPIAMPKMFVDSEKDGVGVKMTAARMSVSGTPVYRISWTLSEEPSDKTACIRLEARMEIRIDEDYLNPLFNMLRTGFDSFISSGVPHA